MEPGDRGFDLHAQHGLKEEANQCVVTFDLPGVDKSKMDAQVKGRQLTVYGASNEKVEKNKGNTIDVERREGPFERSITLPGPVTPTELKAKYDQGELSDFRMGWQALLAKASQKCARTICSGSRGPGPNQSSEHEAQLAVRGAPNGSQTACGNLYSMFGHTP